MSSWALYVQARRLLEGEPRAEKNRLTVIRNGVGNTIQVRRGERRTENLQL